MDVGCCKCKNTSADDAFTGTAKTDINQFISGKPIHLGTNRSQWLLYKTSLLIKTTKNLVKERTGFEFSLHTSEEQ